MYIRSDTWSFDDYTSQKPIPLRQCTNDMLYSYFRSYLEEAPEEYQGFCTHLINDLRSRILDLTITNSSRLLSRSREAEYVAANSTNKSKTCPEAATAFENAKDYFSFIVEQMASIAPYPWADFLTLSFDSDYFSSLYSRYCSYVSSFQKRESLFFEYMNDVYKYYPLSNPLHDTLINFYCNFKYIDKNLVFVKKNTFLWDMSQLDVIVTGKKMDIFNKIPQFLHPDCFDTAAPFCNTNYSFNFAYEGGVYYGYPLDLPRKFQPSSNPNAFLSFIFNLTDYKALQLSDPSIHLLYCLTGGHKEDLEMLAILFAVFCTNYYKNSVYTIPSKNCSPLLLYSVFSSFEGIDFLTDVICSLLYPNSKPYELKDLTKKETLLELIGFNFSHAPAILTIPSSQKETEAQIKTIKRIIQRKPILLKSGRGQELTLINHLPVVCFTNKQSDFNYLTATYRTKTFYFKNIIPNTSILGSIYPWEANKLNFFLSIYGLHLLYCQNWQIPPLSTQTAKRPPNFIRQFLHDRISYETGAITYADKLYECYVAYCNFTQIGTPLTKIVFTKEIRAECSHKCEYKKPRRSRTDNRYAFIGLKIDEEKAQKLVAQMDAKGPKAVPDDFIQLLSEPLEVVHKTVQSILNALALKNP